MEELRSTEILDKEIQDDVRRKAGVIIKNAEQDAAAVLAAVEGRIESIRKEKEAAYEQRILDLRRNAEASVPLKKERFIVSYEDKAVHEAMKNYLSELGLSKKLDLIRKMLERFKNVLNGRRINALYSGFEKKDVEKLLQEELGKDSVVSCEKAPVTAGSFEGFILESDDKAVKCRITIEELIEEILDKNRYELVSTLFGGELPNG